MNGCKTDECLQDQVGRVDTTLIALSVDGFDKALREDEDWSRQVGPLPLALQRGGISLEGRIPISVYFLRLLSQLL